VLAPINNQNNTVYYTNNQKCEMYFSGDLNFELKPYTEYKKEVEKSSGKYSSGTGAGVGIFMLLLGAFIGIVGVIVYNKRKAQNII